MKNLMSGLRFAVVGVVVSLALWATAAGEGVAPACERFLGADDIHIDVRGEVASVVIVNTSDNCALIFSDNLKTAPGLERDEPQAMSVRVETLDGAVLSETTFMGEWFTSVDGQNGADVLDFSLVRLPPGAVRIKRREIHRLLWRIDAYLQSEGRNALPWGSRVVLRLRVHLFTDPDAAAGRFGGSPKGVEVITPPFLYTLPKTAP
jgi:hypothetical protein